MAALMLVMNISTVFAEDEETTAESLHSAYYAFVLEDSQDSLPDEVMALLPETGTDLKDGTVLVNDPLPDVETEDAIYSFLYWSVEEYTICGYDVHFTGTWAKKDKVIETVSTESSDPVKETEEELVRDDGKMITISYVFAEAYSTRTNNLNEEIMALLPGSYEESAYVDHVPVDLSVTQVGDFTFEAWNPYINPETGDITYQGIWISPDSHWTPPTMLRSVGASATFSFDGSWTVPNSVGYHSDTGGVGSRFMLNGQQAYCIEPDVHMDNSYIGQTYYAGGGTGGEIARIIVMGTYNGVDPGSIQAAVWNAIKGTSAGGEPCQPSYSGYSSSGWRIPSLTTYESGALQKLVTPEPPIPDTAKMYVLKVSSDSNYPYKDYPNNYSLAGAVYGVYSDAECTNQLYTLTTDSDGKTRTLEFTEERTLYVKEITSSKGFRIDNTVYTARLRKGNTTEIKSYEDPYSDPVRIILYKKNAKNPDRVKYLDEAEFTACYYDTQEDDISGLSAKKTWVFKPIYNDSGKAVVIMDLEHFVRGDDLPLDSEGYFYLPLGTFTIQETKAPQTYQIDPNVYVGHIYWENDETISVINGGDYLEVENENLTQSECEVILSTTAIFEESGEHRYVADGYAHITDVVEYDYLVPGQTYILRAKLMEATIEEVLWTEEDFENGDCLEEEVGTVKETIKTEGDLVMEAETIFIPESETGTAEVSFDEIDLDERGNTDYVVYEYLFICETETTVDEETGEEIVEILDEEEITYHEDVNDEGQSLHVDELYRAAFVLYKISQGNKNVKLSGAYFTVATHRVKRDGREVDHDLGTYVTGGIYIPAQEGESVKLYKQPQPEIDEETGEEIPPKSDEPVLVGEYSSETNKETKEQAITILGLDDGIYYTEDADGERTTWYIAKGMIFLPDQEEDTQITFTELVAPAGYVKDSKPFVMTVGHDYSVERVENYRSNYFPYVPVTGFDGD